MFMVQAGKRKNDWHKGKEQHRFPPNTCQQVSVWSNKSFFLVKIRKLLSIWKTLFWLSRLIWFATDTECRFLGRQRCFWFRLAQLEGSSVQDAKCICLICKYICPNGKMYFSSLPITFRRRGTQQCCLVEIGSNSELIFSTVCTFSSFPHKIKVIIFTGWQKGYGRIWQDGENLKPQEIKWNSLPANTKEHHLVVKTSPQAKLHKISLLSLVLWLLSLAWVWCSSKPECDEYSDIRFLLYEYIREKSSLRAKKLKKVNWLKVFTQRLICKEKLLSLCCN